MKFSISNESNDKYLLNSSIFSLARQRKPFWNLPLSHLHCGGTQRTRTFSEVPLLTPEGTWVYLQCLADSSSLPLKPKAWTGFATENTCKTAALPQLPRLQRESHLGIGADGTQRLLTSASNTNVSKVSLSEFSIMMLKRASKVSWRNWRHTKCQQTK